MGRETPRPTYIYTLTTGIALSERVGGFVELYGFAPVHDKADHRFDGGLTCLLNNDLMIDLSAGVGLTNNAPDYFVSLGLSCRFSVRSVNNFWFISASNRQQRLADPCVAAKCATQLK